MATSSFTRPIVISDPIAIEKLRNMKPSKNRFLKADIRQITNEQLMKIVDEY